MVLLYKFFGRFTLLQQWVTATFLAILPLVIAVGFAVLSIHQQNNNQQALRDKMDIVTSKDATISASVKEMVRLSRQYVLLGDQSFADLYMEKFKMLKPDLDTLRIYLDSDKQHASIDLMIETAEKVKAFLDSDQVNKPDLSTPLQLLIGLSEELSLQVDRYRRESLQSGEQEFNRIISQLSNLTILTFFGTLLLMFIGITLVSRPILRLSEAIERLANQHWETPIGIRGPSDLVDLGNNLEWMRKQIIASDQQKAAFVQHITHELKTPLAAIIEAGNLFHEEVPGPLTEKQHAILKVQRTNAKNLEHLIQQLLNYNAVSHGIVTQWEHIDLNLLTQSIFGRLKTYDPDKVVNLEIEGTPDKISTDARLLEMILINLLGNAFQFVSNDGNISVQWGQNDHEWYLSVSDDGPGIDPALIPNIFTPFFSAKHDSQSKVPKTGIGLAIVRDCANLLKGRIEVISDVGKGATFSMFFPLTS